MLNTTAVLSVIGETVSGQGLATAGHLKISPDGIKLAMATFSNSIPSSLGNGGFFLFDFDAATGIVSNSITILSGTGIAQGEGPYGMEFSSDGTKLYGATGPYSNTINVIYQWNICAGSPQAIIASQYTIGGVPILGSLQRAIDGKIYISHSGGTYQSLSVINNPNGSGAAMGYSPFAQSVAPRTTALGLPNFINFYTRPAPSPFTSTVYCNQTSFQYLRYQLSVAVVLLHLMPLRDICGISENQYRVQQTLQHCKALFILIQILAPIPFR